MACKYIYNTNNNTSVDVDLLIQPRASKTQIVGEHDDRLKIRLAAPPVDGAANSELIDFLSGKLNIPKRNIEIISGDTGRRKKVRLVGIELSDVEMKLMK